ncbi:MAG: hypothetical protein AAB011_13860 [Candidatus Eisenbacteria bacterium]
MPSSGSTPFPRPRVLAGAIALALMASVFLPAVARTEEDDADSPHRPGAWAAEFEVDPSYRYDLGFSSGVTISAKRHRSARSALRFGASISFYESKSEGESSIERFSVTSNPNLRSTQGARESIEESHGYSLFLHYQRYHPVVDDLSIFWEVGPSLRYSEYESSDDRLYPYYDPTGPTETFRHSRSVVLRTAALDWSIGFELFLKRRLSLGARAGVWAGYSWGAEYDSDEFFTSDNSYYSAYRNWSDLNRVSVQTGPATVTLSAYF